MNLTVLDFNTGTVTVHLLTKEQSKMQCEELLEMFGYNESDCHYMMHSSDVEFA